VFFTSVVGLHESRAIRCTSAAELEEPSCVTSLLGRTHPVVERRASHESP
jgi:hypothetical protein